MSERTTHDGGEQGDDGAGRGTRSGDAVRRRTFLKASAAGAMATGVGLSVTGSAAGEGIPTPWLHRDGNLVKDPSGNEVILRGVNVADPRRLNETAQARGKNAEQVIEYATDESKGWHSRVIRLTVHPGDVAGLPPIPHAEGVRVHEPPTFTKEQLRTYCENHLDPAVQKCEEVGAYAIVDYHRHWGEGELPWGLTDGQNIEPNPPLSAEVQDFWEVIAPRYADRSHVLYEVYNEPTSPDLGAAPINSPYHSGPRWRDWVDVAQPWVDTIRENADNFTIIGSPMWSQYPDGALLEEFEGDDLGYAYHIYPGHDISKNQDNWDYHDDENGQGVQACYEEVPLFATEFGWSPDSSFPGIGTTESFGRDFMAWLDENPIHWTAWCLDPTWRPAMVERPFDTGGEGPNADSIGDPYSGEIPVFCEDLPCDWEALGGEYAGEFVKQVLADKRDQDVPGGGTGTPTETDTETTTDAGERPPAVGDNANRPTDPDGDGLYEDVNGNGGGDLADAVDLYQHRDSSAVQNNVDAYDFSGNDSIDLADVVELYQENLD